MYAVYGRDALIAQGDSIDEKRSALAEPEFIDLSAPPVGNAPLPVLSPEKVAQQGEEGALPAETLVRECVKCVFDLLTMFGMEPMSNTLIGRKVRHSFDVTVDRWTAQAVLLGPGGWMKFAKWKFASYFHAKTDQHAAAPPAPNGLGPENPAILLCGLAGRFADRLARSERGPEFLASVLQLKKGCPRPGDAEVDAQLHKTFEALTTERPLPPKLAAGKMLLDCWGDAADLSADIDIRLDRYSIENQLKRTVREIFAGREGKGAFRLGETRNTSYPDYRALRSSQGWFPSVSASFENNRQSGGSYRTLQGIAENFNLTTFHRETGLKLGHSLVKFRKEREPAFEEHIGAHHHREDILSVDTGHLDRLFAELEESCHRCVDAEPHNRVKLVGLSEALKVRVITKGRAARGFLLQPLQKFMWNRLRKFEVFRLIGQPVDAWQVQKRLGAKLGDGEFYLSGDYSAATDSLAPWVSECVANEISDVCDLSPRDRKLFLEALTRHELVDPENEENIKKQTWGQLMGSVISFPILCIANAALCRWSLELTYLKKMQLDQTTLMVNGDDCVFRTTERGLRLWEDITTFAGLTPSVGKFFLTKQFAQINSANFYRLREPIELLDPSCGKFRQMWFRETPFVNLGLLLGLARSGEQAETDEAGKPSGVGLAERCHELMEFCPPDLRPVVMQKFLDLHRSTIEEVFGNCPWFMPQQWGGVGLPILVPGKKVEEFRLSSRNQVKGIYYYNGDSLARKWAPTDKDLRVASRLREAPQKFPVGVVPADTSWNIRQITQQRIPVSPVYLDDNRADRDTEKLNAIMAIDTIFTVQRDMLPKGSEKDRRRVQLRNRRSWAAALHAANLPPKLGLRTVMAVSPPRPVYPCSVSSSYRTIPSEMELLKRHEQKVTSSWEQALWA